MGSLGRHTNEARGDAAAPPAARRLNHTRPAAALVFAALSAATALGLGLGLGCRKQAPPLADAGAATGLLSPEQAAQVLARVGQRALTVGDFVAALEHMDQFDRIRYQAPERRKELLGEMIDVMLLADEARQQGYDKDPQAEQEAREILRDAVLKNARESAPSPNEIPEAEVRATFESHKTDFYEPERRRVSGIVTANEAAAAGALEALQRRPASWGELVRAKSIDPQAKAEVDPDLAGDLGFVSPPGDPRGRNARIPEPVRAAAFELARVGDVLPRIVAADGKYYVVRLGGKSPGHQRTFVDAERSIRVKLSQEKARAAEEALIDELRRQVPVQIDEAALAQVRVEAVADSGIQAPPAPRFP
jgi:hypothetical protein